MQNRIIGAVAFRQNQIKKDRNTPQNSVSVFF